LFPNYTRHFRRAPLSDDELIAVMENLELMIDVRHRGKRGHREDRTRVRIPGDMRKGRFNHRAQRKQWERLINS
jgi:hypothetical protein